MKIYTEPLIELLYFVEEEILTEVSGNQRTYAAYELNDVLLGGDVGMKRTTTITLEDVQITQ